MVRTQLYLTQAQRAGLDALARATGRKQAALIRDAIETFLSLTQGKRREAILKEAAGMWRERADLPDFRAVRRSWDRGQPQ